MRKRYCCCSLIIANLNEYRPTIYRRCHCMTGCGLDQPVVDRRAPTPKTSDKKAICDPIPPGLLEDVTKPASPMRLQSPDRADAPPFVFADFEVCRERQPPKTHTRGTVSGSRRSPTLSAADAAAARRLEQCRFPMVKPGAQAQLPDECKRFAVPVCRPEIIECPPLSDEFTQPPTETCENYLTKPTNLPQVRKDAKHVKYTENTLFAM